MTAIPPSPDGVAMAAIVSFVEIITAQYVKDLPRCALLPETTKRMR
ncbi:MAG: hypothetical protein MZV64_35565 [Ignavibacteriales bacterium]|nr:hypothetical protein [Ignavibacteriales bacterium]